MVQEHEFRRLVHVQQITQHILVFEKDVVTVEELLETLELEISNVVVIAREHNGGRLVQLDPDDELISHDFIQILETGKG